MWSNPQEPCTEEFTLVTFTKENLNEKTYFL